MKKYMITYHASMEALAAMYEKMRTASAEELNHGIEIWNKWAERCGVHFTDIGAPLNHGQTINVKGNIMNSKRQFSGYSFLEADNLEDAKELLKDHPHLNGWHPDCEIEIHEVMPMQGI